MKAAIIYLILALLFAGVVSAAVIVRYAPAEYFETTTATSTSVNFNWSINSTVNASIETQLYIDDVLNKSLYCTNATACNATVSGLEIAYHTWYVKHVENRTHAVITGDTAGSFLLSNNRTNMNLTYTYNGATQRCVVKFSGNNSNATLIRFQRNLTALITLGNASPFQVFDYGDIPGNCTNVKVYNLSGNGKDVTSSFTFRNCSLNLSTTGLSINNSNVTINWTRLEPILLRINISVIKANVTSAGCNLSVQNFTNDKLRLVTYGSGSGQYINITAGTALGPLGLATGISYGDQANISTDLHYFEVRQTFNQTWLRFAGTSDVIWFNTANGDANFSGMVTANEINIKNAPVQCPAGYFMVRFTGNVSTCAPPSNITNVSFWNGGWIDGNSTCLIIHSPIGSGVLSVCN